MSQADLARQARITIRVTGQRVAVTAPRDYLYDLKKFNRLNEVVLGKLGCTECTSGFDLRWKQFEEVVLPG
ncbi:MAG: hypothetical protein LW860_19875 [Xanthomonadaceae bacterium]|jgi:hypothetical protein|nr:hypothetical protein [Xanthomonadaceae bacterium]